MYDIRRKIYSQNFFRNKTLVSTLVSNSSINKDDLVIEIGPGKGIITEVLCETANRVLAIEIDPQWAEYTKQKLQEKKNLTVYTQDFLQWKLPTTPYKVFANIPFAIEGKIIRKLIEADNPPQDCYLVVMDELAERLSGKKGLNLFYVTHAPWFDFSIDYVFQSTDFTPVPNIQSVLFHFEQKKEPLLPWKKRAQFQQFIELGFGNGDIIRKNLSKKYPTQSIDAILQKLSLSRKIKPTQLKLAEWIVIFEHFQHTNMSGKTPRLKSNNR